MAWIYRYPSPGHFGSMVAEPTAEEVQAWLQELEAAELAIRASILPPAP